MRLGAFLALLLATGAAAAPDVAVVSEEGAVRVSVRAQNTVALDLLGEVARRSGRVLLVAEDVPGGDVLTTIDLRHRALDEVVEILAGAAGLIATIRPDAIAIAPEPIRADPRDLRLRALAAHARSIVENPESDEAVSARIALAEIHLRLDQVESAVDELGRAAASLRALSTDRTGEEQLAQARRISRLLVDAHARLGQWQQVLEHGQPLLSRGEPDPALWLLLGRAHAALGEPAPAHMNLDRVLSEGDPEQAAEAALNLAGLDRKDGRTADALAHLRAAAESPSPATGGTALLALAEMAEAAGNAGQSVSDLALFVKRFPQDERAVPSLLHRVDLLAGPLDDPRRAAELLESGLERHPGCLDRIEGILRVARLWAATGLVERAAGRLDRLLEDLTEDDPGRAGVLETLAGILEDGLLYARARVAYRRLAALPGRDAFGRLRAARCLLHIADEAPRARDQRDELLRCLEEIRALPTAELGEEDRSLRLEIEVSCLQQLGDAEGARKALEEALR